MIELDKKDEMDIFMFRALAELDTVASYEPFDLYGYIVKRDGECRYSRTEVEAWIMDIECLE